MLGFVIHRWCPVATESDLEVIGQSRDGQLTHRARPETISAYQKMKEAAREKGIQLHVIWAFRSPHLQTQHYAEAEEKYGRGKGIRWLAPPGFSEHQTGWVLDLGDWQDPEADDNPLFERTAAFRWLKTYASRYGFELSFPKGNWQGVGYEPWHWRFVGTDASKRTFHPKGFRTLAVWGRSGIESVRRRFFPT